MANNVHVCTKQEQENQLPEMYPQWDPVCKVVVHNTNWDTPAAPYDTFNAILQWIAEGAPRRVHILRRCNASVMVGGAWIYVIWCPGSRRCYLGQCGAWDNMRVVKGRMREHVLLVMGIHQATSEEGKIPLYEWWSCLGLHKVQITGAERVPALKR